jgi:hypothetical protein
VRFVALAMSFRVGCGAGWFSDREGFEVEDTNTLIKNQVLFSRLILIHQFLWSDSRSRGAQGKLSRHSVRKALES